MYIVTGANHSHGRSLLQFVASVQRAEPFTRLVVYDLGLKSAHLEGLHRLGIAPKRFKFEDYPEHVNIEVNSGQYAWKPAIIHAEAEQSQEALCWMDAGNILRSPMIVLRWELFRRGFYSQLSPGTVRTWTHPGMLAALGLPSDYCADKPNLNGACVAFSPRHSLAMQVLREWYEGAMRRDVIAPTGSDRSNHRQDQALLTVLAYRAGLVTRPSPRGRDAFVTQKDVPE